MKKNSPILDGALIGVLLTAALIALFFLGDTLLGLPLAPFDFFAWLTRALPGALITFGIDTMSDSLTALGFNVATTAKTAEHIIAVAIAFAVGVIATMVFFGVRGRLKVKPDGRLGVVLGLLFGVPMVVIHTIVNVTARVPLLIGMLWILVLYILWGVVIERAYYILMTTGFEARAQAADDELDRLSVLQISRRQFLIRLGGATAAITVISAGVSVGLNSGSRKPATGGAASKEGGSLGGESASDIDQPVPGTRSEITPIDQHYKIDINPRPPRIDGNTWRLPITGMVDNPLELSLDEIRNNYTPIDRYITLSCISNDIGGPLISTTLWTGASLQEILADAGIQDGGNHIEITSVDGFHETVALDLINADPRIMLTYEWDGEPLPVEHGFPLRVWIPDRYGMKQPRWITSIEVIDEDRDGYWVVRGWDKTAIVKTVSVIDTVGEPYVDNGEQTLVPVGGIAYAGVRGISKVEVRVDNGHWQEARLYEPLSEATWVLWRYDWPFEVGQHTFEVRCAEGDGTPQIERDASRHPSGATGIHRVDASL